MQAQSKRTDVKQNKYLWLDMRKGKIMEKRMPVIGKAWLKDENEITQWITSKEAEKYRTENWSKVSASDWESGEQINFNELSRKMPGVYDALKHGTSRPASQALTMVSTSERSIRARRFSKASSLPGAST